ncbi:MAG: hypothetical protein PF637_11465 [Spirochaetes bacterium]|jgi:hypothetical protein|nr:hypothetical protein [Spirochaetota bacterium]
MPQISLYIDKDTLEKVEKAAKVEHLSISKWVGLRIKSAVNDEYPRGYFDLFGSIDDDTFKIDSLSFDNDIKRESL